MLLPERACESVGVFQSRTGIEVGNVGDGPAVCFAVENIVVIHGFSPASNSNSLVFSLDVTISLHCQDCRSLKASGFQFLQRAVRFF